MYKREITYKDFNGDTTTETHYFNLSKPEIIEMQVEVDGGLDVWVQKVMKAQDFKELVALMKKLVLQSYGQKTPDGKRFIKSDELSLEFSQTGAYEALFMELATNDGAAAAFVNGVMPADLIEQVNAIPNAPEGGKTAQELIAAAQATVTT